jgi:Na+/H+ antiporter NhaD/arsenite permease-like protein
MLTFKMIIVFFGLIGMVTALVLDKMRPGMILFSVTVLFLCFGILTPKEILEGFSNKGMITVALLFLISEGVRQSGALGQLIKKLLPQEKTTVMKAQARMLPVISFVSAFLNNTPVVVIFALGGICLYSGNQILDPYFVCYYTGGNVYAYRDFY